MSTSIDRKDIIPDSFTPSKAMTLYGIFVPGYEVYFYSGEGTYPDGDYRISVDVEAGDVIGNVTIPQAPAGKTFAGWQTYDETRESWVDVDYEVTTHKPSSTERYRAMFSDVSGAVSLAGAEINLTDTVVYTGKALTPVVTVKYNGKTLTKNTDYTVSYVDNTGVGLAKVTIAGKGNYTGTRTVLFRILFKDVGKDNNFYDEIYWMVDGGYTTGFSDGTYRPWNSVNRVAVVTFLWRMAGEPAPDSIAEFKDMPDDTPANQDFRKAISWAAEQGITTGYKDGSFKPWAKCNRAAMAAFLSRME